MSTLRHQEAGLWWLTRHLPLSYFFLWKVCLLTYRDEKKNWMGKKKHCICMRYFLFKCFSIVYSHSFKIYWPPGAQRHKLCLVGARHMQRQRVKACCHWEITAITATLKSSINSCLQWEASPKVRDSVCMCTTYCGLCISVEWGLHDLRFRKGAPVGKPTGS